MINILLKFGWELLSLMGVAVMAYFNLYYWKYLFKWRNCNRSISNEIDLKVLTLRHCYGRNFLAQLFTFLVDSEIWIK